MVPIFLILYGGDEDDLYATEPYGDVYSGSTDQYGSDGTSTYGGEDELYAVDAVLDTGLSYVDTVLDGDGDSSGNGGVSSYNTSDGYTAEYAGFLTVPVPYHGRYTPDYQPY